MTARAADEVAEGVFCLGGVEPADGRISWIPPGARGFVPINAHLIVEGDEGLLIDTGVAAHRDVILDQLAAVAPGLRRISALLTRAVEFDGIGNVTAFTRTLPLDTVHSHFPSLDWMTFDTVAGEAADPAGVVDCQALSAPATVSVDRAGRRPIEVLAAPLRLLAAFWVFDERSGTLFTSDAFGHALLAKAAAPAVVEAATDTTTREEVSAGLDPKFGWLRTADAQPTREAVAELFAARDVRAIAPGCGAVLQGRDVVRRHVELLLEVLAAPAEMAA